MLSEQTSKVQTSKLIAGLIGPVAVAMGVTLLLNQNLAADMAAKISQDIVPIVISGLLTLIAGVAIVRAHNVWSGWPLIVTLFGWIAVIGGLIRLWFPYWVQSVAADMGSAPHFPIVCGAVMLIAGLFLSYKAYGDK